MERYREIEKTSEAQGEANDCAVMALSLALRCSYANAHTALRKEGRRATSGTERGHTDEAIATLGHRIRRRYTGERLALEVGRRRVTAADARQRPEAWAHLPPLLLFMAGHVAAYVDGRVEDWTADRAAPVLEAYELERVGAPLDTKAEPPPVVYL